MSTLKVETIRHNSATSDAITTHSDGTCTARLTGTDGGGQLSHRNIIINGACMVAQRGTSTSSVTSSGYYACDRQKTQISYGGTWTVSQSTESPSDNGFGYSMKYDCTATRTSLAEYSYLQHYYRVEGQDLQNICKGTSNAKELTLSFWVKTNKTGTYNLELIDQDNSRIVTKSYTVSDTNWNKYVVTFPADTTGSFANDNEVSLDIGWWLVAGSAFVSGSNQTTWAAFSQGVRAPSNVNLADSTSNEWYITGIQLEIGSIATSFEHRSYVEEVQRCRRYFQKFAAVGDHYHFGVARAESNTARTGLAIPVPMRTYPTVTCNGSRTFRGDGGYNSESTSTPSVYSTGNWVSESNMYTVDFPGHSLNHNQMYCLMSKTTSENGITLDSEL